MFNREVDTGNGRRGKAFIDLLIKFYSDCKGWIPSLTNDARQMLDRRHHYFYKSGDTIFFMVFTERHQSAGRLAVLDDRRSQQQRYQHRLFISI